MHHAPHHRARPHRGVEGCARRGDLLLDAGRLQHAARAATARQDELPHQRGVLHDELAPVTVALRHFGKNLFQAAPRDGVVGRKVGAAEEGRAVGREEDGERPTAQAGHRFDGGLVALRHVGALVAIHPHRNEQRVDQSADLGVGVDRPVGLGAPAAHFAADV